MTPTTPDRHATSGDILSSPVMLYTVFLPSVDDELLHGQFGPEFCGPAFSRGLRNRSLVLSRYPLSNMTLHHTAPLDLLIAASANTPLHASAYRILRVTELLPRGVMSRLRLLDFLVQRLSLQRYFWGWDLLTAMKRRDHYLAASADRSLSICNYGVTRSSCSGARRACRLRPSDSPKL